jgi:hypothetical protein
LEAEEGVRMSKMRRWESEVTDERIEGECGEKAELYVQEWVGRVRREVGRWGDHYVESQVQLQHKTAKGREVLTTLIVPSQELEQKVSLETKFQHVE